MPGSFTSFRMTQKGRFLKFVILSEAKNPGRSIFDSIAKKQKTAGKDDSFPAGILMEQ